MNNDKSVAERLKALRSSFGYSQARMGEAIGGTLRAWQEYEAGRRSPRFESLAKLVALGVNANWVLDGQGPMLLSEGGISPEAPPPDGRRMNSGVFTQVMAAVMEEIADAEEADPDLALDPRIRSALVETAYEYCMDAGMKHAMPKIRDILRQTLQQTPPAD